jgi:DNA modification methylase
VSGHAVVLRGNALSLPLPAESVDVIVTSPPYFALRSYRDSSAHIEGQVGAEPTPQEFIESLLLATEEMVRVLKPGGSIFVNLGDKYAGSGGHNNSNLGAAASKGNGSKLQGPQYSQSKEARSFKGGGGADRRAGQREASRRNAPDAYNKATIGGARPKSLMGLPQRYMIGCIDELGLILRAEIIWSKRNGLPESVKDRPRRSHEQIFHFVKQGTYFADIDYVRLPHEELPRYLTRNAKAGRAMREGKPLDGVGMPKHSFKLEQSAHPNGKLPGSVWEISTEPLMVPDYFIEDHNGWRAFGKVTRSDDERVLVRHALWNFAQKAYEAGQEKLDVFEVDHYAAFPTELPRRLILGWCPEGGVVLDPFGGTGTTAMVARAVGCLGISVDLSYDYCRLARWRIFESGYSRKVISRSALERQGSLL